MGANVQVCWDKFCNYWEVEPRLVPMEGGRLHLTGPEAAARCDENTIGVVAILGSTFDGSYEPVAEIAAALDDLQAQTGLDIPIHVDGGVGRLVAPFLDPGPGMGLPASPGGVDQHLGPQVRPRLSRRRLGDLARRRRAARGAGLQRQLPGRRDADLRPELLPARRQVVAQYYAFLRLGREGFRLVQQACRDVASTWPAQIAAWVRSTAHDGTSCRCSPSRPTGRDRYNVFDVSGRLRERGWLVPAYTFPANRQDVAVLRIVVRNGLSRDLAGLLLADLRDQVETLEAAQEHPVPLLPGSQRNSFAH